MISTLLTLTQTADILNITYARAADLARRGFLPTVRLGRQVRIDAVLLKALIAGGGKSLHAEPVTGPDERPPNHSRQGSRWEPDRER